VTVPYKLAVIPQLDDLDEVAAAIGAVNCVTIENERLIGHNTDAPAFQQTLDEGERKAFVMGTGGAARAVAYALEQRHIEYTFVSLTPENHPKAISYDEMRQEAWKQPRLLIVNATPVGMYPEVDSTPLGLQAPEGDVLVYDLIYNPSPTRLLREAAALGMRTKNGLEMLHLQADLSWKIWENKEIGIKN
jgi:shikimate dehydrogenase